TAGGPPGVGGPRQSAAKNTPLFAFPAGSSQLLQDVRIADLFTTGLVSVGDTARVAVTLESTGFDNRPVKVELRENDKVIDSKDLVLRSTEQQQIDLTFKAEKAGPHYLTVRVPHCRRRPTTCARITKTWPSSASARKS